MDFNIEALENIIAAYKKNFSKISSEEIYKWEAVQCFQANWDINADNFQEMLSKSLAKSSNLLNSRNYFPRNMIIIFSEKDPEAVRAMFRDLFDETKNIVERIEAFIKSADHLLSKYGEDSWKMHYQNTNSISIYLFFRFPEKYYIYKYQKFKDMATKIGYKQLPLRGRNESIVHYFEMCNSIHEFIIKDQELCSLSRERLGDGQYADPEFHILTEDVVYFGSRYEEVAGWWPKEGDYSPNLAKEDWIRLIGDDKVFVKDSLAIMKRLLHYGGAATCKELSSTYGESPNYYNSGSSSLAQRVHKVTDCPLLEQDSGNAKWWPILYTGKYAGKENKGNFIWKMREELKEALEMIDLSDVPLYAEDKSKTMRNYWWLNANPKIWSFNSLRVGDEQMYTMYNENGNKRRIFQNFLDVRKNDLIIGYESTPVKQITSLCKLTQEQDGEKITFEKIESFPAPIDYTVLKEIKELEGMEYFQNPNGSLFKLTEEEFQQIMDLVREQNPSTKTEEMQPYTKQDFLSEVFMDEFQYDTLVSLLKHKKNIILQGAPGVGKTFAAKRLAYSILGQKEEKNIEFVQFHQNYSYEDFIMGYKPQGEGFELQYGVFYRFCKKAENNPDKEYFFIIDEINRGNLSKIFGELLMLIEKDYRGTNMTMAYNGLPFAVPENVYIIGMMNTADRSLALIDYALRRRFSFIDLSPAFYSDGFRQYQESLANEAFDELILQIKALNQEIANDPSLGSGFSIGHSYFSSQAICTEDWLSEVIEYDILPMLREYWFDDADKVRKWENRLRGVLND